jgi:DNA-binding NarL/FixJ family response regulator
MPDQRAPPHHRARNLLRIAQGYRRVLENQRDFQVVAEADDAASAYGAFKTHAPDIVTMDISMPGASGLEASRFGLRAS